MKPSCSPNYLDHGDSVVVIIVYLCTGQSLHVSIDDWEATGEEVHDCGEYFRLHQLPLTLVVVFGYYDEIRPEEYSFNAVYPGNVPG